MKLEVGAVLSWERTFTDEEVQRFAELSGDRGAHHMQRDDKGRLMVHGLLTASVATKIGGDFSYIAREMDFEFLRPVFTGDTITCEVTVTDITPRDGYTELALKSVYRNQHGKEVLAGTSRGIVRD